MDAGYFQYSPFAALTDAMMINIISSSATTPIIDKHIIPRGIVTKSKMNMRESTPRAPTYINQLIIKFRIFLPCLFTFSFLSLPINHMTSGMAKPNPPVRKPANCDICINSR